MGNGCSRRVEPVTVPLPLNNIVLRPEELKVYEERTATALRGRRDAEEQLRNKEGEFQRQLAAAAAEKEEQAEENKRLKERLEREAAELLSTGGVARQNLEVINEFVNKISQKSAVTLREAIEANKTYCRAKKFDLATGHQGNVSQLYRLLNEEIAELMAELKKPMIIKREAAKEADDVLSYALQFVWEFSLENCIEGGATGSGPHIEGHSDFQALSLQLTFPELQRSFTSSLHVSKDGKHALVDLGKLPLLGNVMADSVRAINGDFKKKRISEQEARQNLAKDISRIVHAVAELTVLFAVDLSTESVCGNQGKKKNYYKK